MIKYLPISWLLLASLAFGQTGLQIQTENQSRAPELSAVQAELTPMIHVSGSTVNGTTQAEGEANDAFFESYYSTNWNVKGIVPHLGTRGYGLWDGFTIPYEGMRLNGSGLCDTRAEAEFVGRGGAASRLVALNPAADYLIYHRGGWFVTDGVTYYGRWHGNNASTLKADTANFLPVGILVGCQNNGIGSGKIHAPSGLNMCCFETAIQLGDAWDGDNADQLNLASFRPLDCEVGIHSICRQSVGHWIAQYEGTRTGTMLYIERGGEFQIGQAIMENADPIFLRTRANLWDDGTFHVNFLKVDGSVTGTAKLWQADAHVPFGDDGIESTADDEGFSSNTLTIDYLKIVYGISNAPTVEMRGYQTFHVRGGGLLFDNFVTCHSGAGSFYPVIIIENCKFRSGEDPTNVINEAASDGKWRVILRNNCDIGGVPFEDQSFIATKSGETVTRDYYDAHPDPDARVSPFRIQHRPEPIEHYHAIAA